jgi:hypothetical protein
MPKCLVFRSLSNMPSDKGIFKKDQKNHWNVPYKKKSKKSFKCAPKKGNKSIENFGQMGPNKKKLAKNRQRSISCVLK